MIPSKPFIPEWLGQVAIVLLLLLPIMLAIRGCSSALKVERFERERAKTKEEDDRRVQPCMAFGGLPREKVPARCFADFRPLQ